MQIKRPHIAPAIALIGRVTPEAMSRVLRALDQYSAGLWRVDRVGRNRTDGDYFVVAYWPTDRTPGRAWEIVFGFDGSVWSD